MQPSYNPIGSRFSQPAAANRGPIIQPGFFPVKKSQASTTWLTATVNSAPSSSSSSSQKPQPSITDKNAEEINVPNFQDDYRVYTAAETENELRDLMGGSMNQELEEEVDMADAIVDGFKEGITLLPHQIVGRAWMKERETGKKAGGILADDMGYVYRFVSRVHY